MKNAKCEEEDEGRRVENEGEKAKENAKRANESVNDWIFCLFCGNFSEISILRRSQSVERAILQQTWENFFPPSKNKPSELST